jgi:hypothetical protein
MLLAAPLRYKLSHTLLIATALAVTCVRAHAEGDGCASFTWPLVVERQWLTASDLPSYKSGASLPAFPRNGFALKLAPIQDVTFAADPEKPAKNGWGGLVLLPPPENPGLHQITLSENGWVDILQGGARLASLAHTGRQDCAGLRKSVRFELGSAPVTVQISGAMNDTINIAIRQASED